MLDADTAYFVVVDGNGLNDRGDEFDPRPGYLFFDSTNTQPSGAYANTNSYGWQADSGNLQMKIEANVVPEPTSALLLLLSGSTFCFQRRRAARA